MFARTALLVTALLLAPVPAAAATVHSGHCARLDRLHVPGAPVQRAACLSELTTAGTVGSGHTVPADWAGLTAAGLPQPSGVPGIQIDGYFLDTSTTNPNNGWNHDAQFVLRLPDRWTGGLVVSGAPGSRRQYANDRAISDAVLARGYAFAATDKGNTGAEFFTDGARPGDAVAEWNTRVTQLALAARAVLAQRYGRPPARTLMAGLSNGGYLVRWQLERNPWLFDGGVDWEGTLWRADGPNLFTFLPPALRGYPAGDHAQLLAAGFAPGSEFLWDFHHRVYWDITQRAYRQEFDPSYTGAEADYDYAGRPAAVHQAVHRISLTGRITRPLITLHGTLDSLLPISQSSDAYARMVDDAGRDRLHRYYRIETGNHVDGLVDTHPDRLRPMAPCFLAAFDALSTWLRGQPPVPSRTIAPNLACAFR
ncbi:MAG TPA: tannase/feruloyl esterase family alpha/beta hydrolase [Actinophytocola sp.]|uniref:tannase/feruloyl esterase family alpha/beta hydrolase n=1 Tax=Actinophytocola sp. TaxID=1872138 RepID=UPI002DBA2BA0|nr:tannase/feruloyl esterase family alpha/beta hydrolase [Actinophytocola sp.]HEU5469767.1 tannase/feruloyl esterase family alpha/beta hydrolase [Actinophytocola sp.]